MKADLHIHYIYIHTLTIHCQPQTEHCLPVTIVRHIGQCPYRNNPCLCWQSHGTRKHTVCTKLNIKLILQWVVFIITTAFSLVKVNRLPVFLCTTWTYVAVSSQSREGWAGTDPVGRFGEQTFWLRRELNEDSCLYSP